MIPGMVVSSLDMLYMHKCLFKFCSRITFLYIMSLSMLALKRAVFKVWYFQYDIQNPSLDHVPHSSWHTNTGKSYIYIYIHTHTHTHTHSGTSIYRSHNDRFPACTVRHFWSQMKFHINNIIYSRIHHSPNYRFTALIVCNSRSRRSISRMDRLKKK
jgi:hypothetical protein